MNTRDMSIQHEEIRDAFYLEIPELYERYKKCIPPKEAYYYFPKGEEVMIYNEKKPHKAVRRIYVNQQYTDQENKWIGKFKEIIAQHPETRFPYFWNDALNLTLIYSTNCVLDKAFERMVKLFEWYEQTFPLTINIGDGCWKVLNTGCLYIHGRDHQFRPILVLQPSIIIKLIDKFNESDIINAGIFLCQFMANHMLIPGQIENWIMWINAKDVSVIGIPESLKKMINVLSDGFPSRLYRSYIFGMSAFLRILYKIICSFLEEVTVNKFVILDGVNDPRKFRDISPQNLEQKFGGEAPNVIYDQPNGLFPPIMPSYNYFKEDEEPKEILLSKQEYLNLYLSGKIPNQSISPYFLENLNRQKQREELEQKKIEDKNRRQLQNKNSLKERIIKYDMICSKDWTLNKELFDLNKFKYKKNKYIDEMKNLSLTKKNFSKNIVLLNNND